MHPHTPFRGTLVTQDKISHAQEHDIRCFQYITYLGYDSPSLCLAVKTTFRINAALHGG